VPSSTLALPSVRWTSKSVSIILNPATAGFFVYNPLLNIKMGGFVIPCDTEIPLGAIFEVEINDMNGDLIVKGKGKVVARQERRAGLRLSDVDKQAMSRLTAEVNRMAPPK